MTLALGWFLKGVGITLLFLLSVDALQENNGGGLSLFVMGSFSLVIYLLGVLLSLRKKHKVVDFSE